MIICDHDAHRLSLMQLRNIDFQSLLLSRGFPNEKRLSLLKMHLILKVLARLLIHIIDKVRGIEDRWTLKQLDDQFCYN